MKLTLKIIGSTLLLLSAVQFAAANEFRIGVIDMERIQRESSPSVNAGKKIMKEFEMRDLEIKKISKQIKEIQIYFDKESMPVMDAEHRSKERELANLNVNLQRMQREFREDLILRQNEEMAMVFSRVNKAIKTVAETEKYDLILQEAVYRNPQIDITDKVLQYLSAEK
jgi:outer membrane protein